MIYSGLGRLHVQCNQLRLRLPLGSVITIMITQFSKVIEYDYDYMTKVIDYNYDYFCHVIVIVFDYFTELCNHNRNHTAKR